MDPKYDRESITAAHRSNLGFWIRRSGIGHGLPRSFCVYRRSFFARRAEFGARHLVPAAPPAAVSTRLKPQLPALRFLCLRHDFVRRLVLPAGGLAVYHRLECRLYHRDV